MVSYKINLFLKPQFYTIINKKRLTSLYFYPTLTIINYFLNFIKLIFLKKIFDFHIKLIKLANPTSKQLESFSKFKQKWSNLGSNFFFYKKELQLLNFKLKIKLLKLKYLQLQIIKRLNQPFKGNIKQNNFYFYINRIIYTQLRVYFKFIFRSYRVILYKYLKTQEKVKLNYKTVFTYKNKFLKNENKSKIKAKFQLTSKLYQKNKPLKYQNYDYHMYKFGGICYELLFKTQKKDINKVIKLLKHNRNLRVFLTKFVIYKLI